MARRLFWSCAAAAAVILAVTAWLVLLNNAPIDWAILHCPACHL